MSDMKYLPLLERCTFGAQYKKDVAATLVIFRSKNCSDEYDLPVYQSNMECKQVSQRKPETDYCPFATSKRPFVSLHKINSRLKILLHQHLENRKLKDERLVI